MQLTVWIPVVPAGMFSACADAQVPPLKVPPVEVGVIVMLVLHLPEPPTVFPVILYVAVNVTVVESPPTAEY